MTRNKVFFTIVVLFYIFIRVIYLGADISNTDAYRWHLRSQNFLSALKSLNLEKTYQHYQPGVTLMWINAIVKQVSFSFQFHILDNLNPQTLNNFEYYPILHGASKMLLVLVLFLIFLLHLKLLGDLFSPKTALIYALLISLEPYLIGIDRWFHLTSLETYLAFTSFLFVLKYKKKAKQNLLILSGVFLGLSIITKVTSIILIPFFTYIIVYRLPNISKIKYSGMFYFSTILTIFLLMPSLWVNPLGVLAKIINASTSAVSDYYRIDLISGNLKWAYYYLVLIFKLSPVLIVGLIYSVKKMFGKKFEINAGYFVVFYVFYYLIILSLAEQKIDRYIINVLPPIALLTSMWLESLNFSKLRLVLTFHLVWFSLSFYLFFPVFSSYYNPIFGGTKQAVRIGIYDNSGEYFSNSALFLNQFGRDKKVYIPNGEASFRYYYGGVITDNAGNADFVVSSLDISRKEFNNYGCGQLLSSFGTREADIVKVYKCTVTR